MGIILKRFILLLVVLLSISSVSAERTILDSEFTEYPFSITCSENFQSFYWQEVGTILAPVSLSVYGAWQYYDVEGYSACDPSNYIHTSQYLDFYGDYLTINMYGGGYQLPYVTTAKLNYLFTDTYDLSDENSYFGFNLSSVFEPTVTHITIRLYDDRLNYLYHAEYISALSEYDYPVFPDWKLATFNKNNVYKDTGIDWTRIKQIEVIFQFWEMEGYYSNVMIDDLFIDEYEDPFHPPVIIPTHANNTEFILGTGDITLTALFTDAGNDFLTKSVWYSETSEDFTWESKAISTNLYDETVGFIIPVNYLPDSFWIKYCAYHYQEPTFYCINHRYTVNYPVFYSPLRLHHKMDTGSGITSFDSSNFSNDGSITSENWLSSLDCALGNSCLDLDGSTSLIDIPYDLSFNYINDFTLTGWIYINNQTNSTSYIISTLNESKFGYAIKLIKKQSVYPNNYDFGFITRHTEQEALVYKLWHTNLNEKEWYHFALTYDEPTLNLYINGALIDTFNKEFWLNDSSIISGLENIEDGYPSPMVFQKDSTWYLIAGEYNGVFHGYNWTGLTWQSDNNIISGLGSIGQLSSSTIFKKDGTWYLIAGAYDGFYYGFNWTGSTWQSDNIIISGLIDIGSASKPMVFQKDEIWYLISGENTGLFVGYNWTGSIWQSDNVIISGLGDVGFSSAPMVFQKDSTLYLISGNNSGEFTGYNWTGLTWQSDNNIISGLADVGFYSTLTIFYESGVWYLIAGEDGGDFIGFGGFINTLKGTLRPSEENLCIGSYNCNIPKNFLKGRIDDFRIYNYSLSLTEILVFSSVFNDIDLRISSEIFDIASNTWKYTLIWDNYPTADLYHSYYKINETEWVDNVYHIISKRSAIFSNLDCKTLYYFNISIVDMLGNEDISFVINDTTDACLAISTLPEVVAEGRGIEETIYDISTVIASLFTFACFIMIIVLLERAMK